jgi:DNA-binding NarL/FixJ family response regulator
MAKVSGTATATALPDDVMEPGGQLEDSRDVISKLSPREREVAYLVAQGLSDREISHRLVISRRTAESHVAHILTKLGFSSRVQVAACMVRLS